VGGVGYNSVYECGVAGVPLVAFAFKQLCDRQNKRAAKIYHVQNIADAIDSV
jgi:UDP:flavonoid glycosyltransferase YjiC (YdhE family)